MTWLVAPLSSIRLPDLWTPTGSPGGPRLRRAWQVVPAGIGVRFFLFVSFFFPLLFFVFLFLFFCFCFFFRFVRPRWAPGP